MNPFTLDIQGFAEIQKRLRGAPDRIRKQLSGVVERGVGKISQRAKRAAPTDEGRLKNAISYKGKDLRFEVVSPVGYSPFIEWGTKRHAKVPSNLADYAAQFKGLKTGSAEEALNAIQGWVRRKGIRFDSAGVVKSGKRKGTNKKLTLEQTAYIIFHFIMINGIKPHPFFFPSLDQETPGIIRDAENVLDI